MSPSSDVSSAVIVGGGIVGGLTALLLAQAGIQIILLDNAPLLNEHQTLEQINPRVLALNPATIHLLQQVEVWQHLRRFEPYSGMQVWSQQGMGELFFGSANESVPRPDTWLGCMVEPSILNLAIQQQLSKVQHIDYRTGVHVQRIERYPQHWQVCLATGETFNTALVIGADGANSLVRQQAGIEIDELDYQQMAIGCAIKTEQAHQHVARQIFLETGPLAFLPLHHQREAGTWQSIVWTLPTDVAQDYMQLDEKAFNQKLSQASQYMLGQVQCSISRAAFPLKARHARHYVQTGLALVGDAAHTIHPLAGQGVNIGCLDAAVLADRLIAAAQRGVWANIHSLRQYEHQRKQHNGFMMHSMSALGWIHRTQIRPFQWFRNEAVHLISKQEHALTFFNQHASGLPTLATTRYAAI